MDQQIRALERSLQRRGQAVRVIPQELWDQIQQFLQKEMFILRNNAYSKYATPTPPGHPGGPFYPLREMDIWQLDIPAEDKQCRYCHPTYIEIPHREGCRLERLMQTIQQFEKKD